MRRVLLARPSDFMVQRMSELLGASRFEPVVSVSLAEWAEADFAGAVLSTSLTSNLPKPLGETFREVRGLFPELPIAITTLMRQREAIDALLRSELPQGLELFGLDGPVPAERRPNQILVLRADDLSPEAGTSAAAALGAHFA